MSVESPCINICKLDDNKICSGCRRTIDEIAGWIKFTDIEKLKVLQRINDETNKNNVGH